MKRGIRQGRGALASLLKELRTAPANRPCRKNFGKAFRWSLRPCNQGAGIAVGRMRPGDRATHRDSRQRRHRGNGVDPEKMMVIGVTSRSIAHTGRVVVVMRLVMTEVPSRGFRFMCTGGRCRTPDGLEREQHHQKDEDESAHDSSLAVEHGSCCPLAPGCKGHRECVCR